MTPTTSDARTPAQTQPDLVALVGSRMAHDLNNPIGAIANGVELLSLTGEAGGPELALITESVENARRRIKRFRIAFGHAAPGQTVSAREIAEVTAPGPDRRRLDIDWPLTGDLPRRDAKRVMLALMCIESAMPWGGRAEVRAGNGTGHDTGRQADGQTDGHGWQIAAQAERMQLDESLWAMLDGGSVPADLTANAVHFALLAREIGGPATALEITETTVTLAF